MASFYQVFKDEPACKYAEAYCEYDGDVEVVCGKCQHGKLFCCKCRMCMADAVLVSELEKLRDYLYAEDLIFMRGLAELNKLIANCGAKMDEVNE